MGSTTPVFLFPYPVGTDRVADGDNAIQALAERAESVKPVRVALTPGPNMQGQDADGLTAWRMPGFVIIRIFGFPSVAIAAGATIATIPAGIRPAVRVFNTAPVYTPAWAVNGVEATPAGVVLVNNAVANGSIFGATLVYPLGAASATLLPAPESPDEINPLEER